jgi:DNA topoisomerase-3
MDDQVRSLTSHGLRAAAIHSGLSRDQARAHALAYSQGQLDFLFLAPERLAVPGVLAWLERHRPSLIAIDEAHCISHWGHEFRAEYRRLGERLQSLRPCPIIATTATATPRVQADIVSELRLKTPLVRIHGFRRDNLAVSAVEAKPSTRFATIARILANPEARPAIIYAGTRKEVEKLHQGLSTKFRIGPYHAGLDPQSRRAIAADFSNGKLDIITATTAFGMGIDKANIRTVVHSFIPASLENYYQEIGRAGRDGNLSRTVLLYATSDIFTHEYLHKLNFPEVSELERLYTSVPETFTPIDAIKGAWDPANLDTLVDKLWIHGGLLRRGTEIARGPADWLGAYKQQKQFKKNEPWTMLKFARDLSVCRMTALARHFGERSHKTQGCGLCDVCRGH